MLYWLHCAKIFSYLFGFLHNYWCRGGGGLPEICRNSPWANLRLHRSICWRRVTDRTLFDANISRQSWESSRFAKKRYEKKQGKVGIPVVIETSNILSCIGVTECWESCSFWLLLCLCQCYLVVIMMPLSCKVHKNVVWMTTLNQTILTKDIFGVDGVLCTRIYGGQHNSELFLNKGLLKFNRTIFFDRVFCCTLFKSFE